MSGKIIAFVLVVAGAGSLIRAQTTTATLSGVVRDAQGGGVPNTAISVVQIETGQSRQTTSGSTGGYSIPICQSATTVSPGPLPVLRKS